MRVSPKKSLWSLIVVAALVITVAILAVLQFRWIGQVSEFEHERLQSSLSVAVRNFRQDFTEELLRLRFAFRSEPFHSTEGAEGIFAFRWDEWRRSAPHPELLTSVYFWVPESPGNPQQLRRLDPASHRFNAVPIPAAWNGVLGRLTEESLDRSVMTVWEMRRLYWTVEESLPALVHPVFRVDPSGEEESDAPAEFLGYLVLEMDRNYVEKTLLPGLAERYFSGKDGWDYHVAVFSQLPGLGTLYQSTPDAQKISSQAADSISPLLDRFETVGGRSTPPPPPMLMPSSPAAEWKLIVRHRSGSLDAAVSRLRRRNLMISAGVLLLLAGSVSLILLSARRAQNLAQMQMDFVAGVSHELRTPLAVMISAADNLAHGVVDPARQAGRYGALIGNEGRRLTAMIEQILGFAEVQRGRPQYDRQPLAVAPVIDQVLGDAAAQLDTAGFTVDRTIDPELPMVAGNAIALRQCLENLVSNAVKYGDAGHWLGIRAELAKEADPAEVRITVADRGDGIAPADLPHLFKPFYRGQAVLGTHIRGMGLGLNIAKALAEAMGGRLTVVSKQGQGSAFTLHLAPAQPPVSEPKPVLEHTA